VRNGATHDMDRHHAQLSRTLANHQANRGGALGLIEERSDRAFKCNVRDATSQPGQIVRQAQMRLE